MSRNKLLIRKQLLKMVNNNIKWYSYLLYKTENGIGINLLNYVTAIFM